MTYTGQLIEALAAREGGKLNALILGALTEILPPARELKAAMELRSLSLRTVATAAGLNYSTVSQLLNGRMIHPLKLAQVAGAIYSFRLGGDGQ
jgi:hypothetical protein